MFKKRNKKSPIDLNTEVNSITTHQSTIHTPPNPHGFSNHIRNVRSLDQLENQINIPPTLYPQQGHTISKQHEQLQLQQCFQQFKKYNDEKQNEQQPVDKPTNKMVIPIHRDNSVEEQSIEAKKQEHMEQMIMQDEEDGVEILPYNIDLGQISPQDQSSEEYEDCYENQIIKKNVSREAYSKLHVGLKGAHRLSQKQKYIKQIQHITEARIRQKLMKDLRVKKCRRDQLRNQLLAYHQKNKNREASRKDKLKQKEEVEAKFRDLEKIIKYIYYYGDSIEEFDQLKILDALKSSKGLKRMERIQRHRRIIDDRVQRKKRKETNKADKKEQEEEMFIPLPDSKNKSKFKSNKARREKEQEEDQEIQEEYGFVKKKPHKYAMDQHYEELEESEEEDDFMIQ